MPSLASVRPGLSAAPVRIAAQAAVLAAVVAGTVAYAGNSKTFTISVDGRTEQVHGDARTVRALLADEDVAVSTRDLVAPALDSPIKDGQQVVVRYARPLSVTVDGKPQTFWTTELTLDSALAAVGIRADDARLSVSRSQPLGRDGLSLSVSTPKTVSLAVDGATRSVVTTAPTVADLLTEQRITLGPLDTTSALPSAPVVDGLALAVTRVSRSTVTQVEAIPFGTDETKSSDLVVGTRKVVTAGQKGSRRATYTVTLVNGKESGRELVSATVLDAPQDAVVAVGTKPKPQDETPSSDSTGSATTGTKADSLNWAALAKCESGGNPRAVNPAGYYGLYQFSLSTWRSVGGTGNPIDASPSEQLLRAKILYNKAGAGQWGCGRHLFD